jgi:hypothetical protein
MNDPNERKCHRCGYALKHAPDGKHDCVMRLTLRLNAALNALQLMFDQYCSAGRSSDGREQFQHFHMTAGEEASDILIAEDRITPDQVLD